MTENVPALPAPEVDFADKARQRKQRWILVGIIAAVIILLAAIGVAVYFLLQPGAPTGTIRDIFIIFMAFESLVIGLALIILIIQLAGLINLLQNEVKPILQSTKETISTLRGTTEFLSDNLVEPVIKLNSYLAGLKKLLDLFRLGR